MSATAFPVASVFLGKGNSYQYQKCFVRLRLDTNKKWKLKQNSANSALFYCHYNLAAKRVRYTNGFICEVGHAGSTKFSKLVKALAKEKFS